MTVYADAGHAGCLRTRKSTSGGVVVWSKALLKAWSRTQPLIALSSGESELAALTEAAAEAAEDVLRALPLSEELVAEHRQVTIRDVVAAVAAYVAVAAAAVVAEVAAAAVVAAGSCLAYLPGL